MRAGTGAALGVAGLVALLAGCGAAPPAGPSVVSPSLRASPAASRKVPLTQQWEASVDFAAVGGPDQVLVAVGPGPDGGPGVRLLAASATGTGVRDIGPRVPADQAPDSVFFLDRQHGWFATFSEDASDETLYRTSDGGRTWQAFPAPGHVLAAGSTDAVQFVTPEVGWLDDVQPTGPIETLYHTTDGGATWQQVAVLHGMPPLPRLGVVEFESGGAVGWLGNAVGTLGVVASYPGPLQFTTDQGRAWQVAAVPQGQADIAGVPALFGTTLIEPVVECAPGPTELRTYLSLDDGAHWSLTSTADLAPGCQQVSTAFPSLTAWWAATLSDGRVMVERTTDQGHTWTSVATPALTTSYPPQIVALDAGHAWLLVAAADGSGTRVYVTADAGQTWQRVDQNFTS